MNPNIKEAINLMTAEVQSLKRSRPDEVDSSPVSSESPAKKKKAETPKDDEGKIVANHEPSSKITSVPKYTCQKCSYVGKEGSHLKSHYFYHHLTDEEKRQIAPFICDFCPFSIINSRHFAIHVASKHGQTISPKAIRNDWSDRLTDMIQKGLGSVSLPVKKRRASVKSPGQTNSKRSPPNKKPVCTLTKVSKPAESSISEPCVLQGPDSGSKQSSGLGLSSKNLEETENCKWCTELVSRPASLRKHRFLKHMSEKEKRKVALYKCDMCPFSSLENIAFARHLRNVHSKPLINAAGSRKTRISQDTEPERPDVVVSSQDLFSCPDCGKFKAEDQKEFYLHMEEHGKFVAYTSLAFLEENYNIKFCSAKKSKQPRPPMFYCRKCSFTHYQSSEMIAHYKSEHKD